jgi:superfamily I DNA and/or RNA helicase
MIMKHVKPLGPNSIAIITPYKEQMLRMREMIQDNLSSLIEVNTVDAFQGQEKDVIIFASVRSKDLRGELKGIGFLRDTRRLNVALTRAKYCLYTVGRKV